MNIMRSWRFPQFYVRLITGPTLRHLTLSSSVAGGPGGSSGSADLISQVQMEKQWETMRHVLKLIENHFIIQIYYNNHIVYIYIYIFMFTSFVGLASEFWKACVRLRALGDSPATCSEGDDQWSLERPQTASPMCGAGFRKTMENF